MILKRYFLPRVVMCPALVSVSRSLRFSRWHAGLFKILPVANDRASLAIVPPLFGNLLRYKAIVAKLVRPVFVIEKDHADIFPAFSDIDFGLLYFGDIDACLNHFCFLLSSFHF
jgi:hypothetical protein